MVTYSSTKRILSLNVTTIKDIARLQNMKVALLDAFAFQLKHEEYGMTQEAVKRGFIFISEDPAVRYANKDNFLVVNINHQLKNIDKQLNSLYKTA